MPLNGAPAANQVPAWRTPMAAKYAAKACVPASAGLSAANAPANCRARRSVDRYLSGNFRAAGGIYPKRAKNASSSGPQVASAEHLDKQTGATSLEGPRLCGGSPGPSTLVTSRTVSVSHPYINFSLPRRPPRPTTNAPFAQTRGHIHRHGRPRLGSFVPTTDLPVPVGSRPSAALPQFLGAAARRMTSLPCALTP